MLRSFPRRVEKTPQEELRSVAKRQRKWIRRRNTQQKIANTMARGVGGGDDDDDDEDSYGGGDDDDSYGGGTDDVGQS